MKNKYTFKPYHNSYPNLFLKEKQRLKQVLDSIIAIEHVGSTAIKGLGGKGIIDIAIAAELKNWPAIKQQLKKLGYFYHETASSSERFFFEIDLFTDSGSLQRYHLHLMEFEKEQWNHFIKFRDTLKNNPTLLNEYTLIKKQASKEAGQKGSVYRNMKKAFIDRVLTQ